MLHVAILRKVREGREAEFESKLAAFFGEAQAAAGVSGAYLVRPAQGPEREYGILRSFASEEDMQAFYASPLFKRWETEVAPLVEGEAVRRTLHGLEAFFREKGAPPRWKMAVVTWLGVTPSVYVFSRGVPAIVGPLPPLAQLMLVNVFVVVALTWLVMPLLTKAFAGWLGR